MGNSAKREKPTIRSMTSNDLHVEGTKLVGLAVPWMQRSDLISERGERFYEYIRPDALKPASNVYFFYDHDEMACYGSTEAGNLTLRSTERGIEFSLDVPQYADRLKADIAKGIVAGMSWRMDDYTFDAEGKNRFVKSGSFSEISATSKPCYPSTSVKIENPSAKHKARLRELQMAN